MNKMTERQYDDMVRHVALTRHEYPSLRYGQYTFVVLYERFPNIAEQISDTEYDPFYRNDLLPLFYRRLHGEYVKQSKPLISDTAGAILMALAWAVGFASGLAW